MIKRLTFLAAVIAAFVFFNVNAINQQSAPKTPIRFNDMDENHSWASEAVNVLVEKGAVNGIEDNVFAPDSLVTKEQFTKMLVLAIGTELNKEPTQTYVDVSPERWSFVYVESAKQMLPVDADLPINEFSPEKQYTREEVAAAAVKSLGLADGNIINKNVLTEHFTDADQTSPSLAGLVGIAAERGILQGADKLSRPKATVTRAEAAVFVYRALQIKEGKGNTNMLTQTPIMGDSTVTVDQAKKWATEKGADERYINIADTYWEYVKKTGIRPEVLYAQAAKETNYGKYTGRVKPEQNNWAGIKTDIATGDLPEDHETFSSPEEGVRAHFNHMSAYLGIDPVGEPHARYAIVKRTAWAGTVKLAEDLGGKWAPEQTYGYDLVTRYLKPMEETK